MKKQLTEFRADCRVSGNAPLELRQKIMRIARTYSPILDIDDVINMGAGYDSAPPILSIDFSLDLASNSPFPKPHSFVYEDTNGDIVIDVISRFENRGNLIKNFFDEIAPYVVTNSLKPIGYQNFLNENARYFRINKVSKELESIPRWEYHDTKGIEGNYYYVYRVYPLGVGKNDDIDLYGGNDLVKAIDVFAESLYCTRWINYIDVFNDYNRTGHFECRNDASVTDIRSMLIERRIIT